jgi:UrcA family protein
MSRPTIVAACAAALFTVLTVTIAVSPAQAENLVVSADRNATLTTTVRYSDLNLASARGREQLDRRVRGAIRQVCGEPVIMPLSQRLSERRCVSGAWQGAEPQVAAAIEGRSIASRSGAIVIAAR